MENNSEDNIRPVDDVFSETMLDDTRSQFEQELDEAINLSIQEINHQRALNKKYEEQIIQDYINERNKRFQIFKEFLLNIDKIKKFDKEVDEIYNIIHPIIESYCSQYVETCKLDAEKYEKTFKIIKKIRNNNLVFDSLKKIIIKDM